METEQSVVKDRKSTLDDRLTSIMAYQQLAADAYEELNKANGTIRQLRFEIASLNEKLAGSAAPVATKAENIDVQELKRDVATVTTERDQKAQAAAAAETTLTKSLARFSRVELELQQQVLALQNQLNTGNEQFQRAKQEYYRMQEDLGKQSGRAESLQHEVERLKKDLEQQQQLQLTPDAAQAETVRRQAQMISQLQIQLQAANKDLARKQGFGPSSPDKACDEDDEEELPLMRRIKAEKAATLLHDGVEDDENGRPLAQRVAKSASGSSTNSFAPTRTSPELTIRTKPENSTRTPATPSKSTPLISKPPQTPIRKSPVSTSKPSKTPSRKRQALDEDMADLEIEETSSLSQPAKRAKAASRAKANLVPRTAYEDETIPFEFKMVYGYTNAHEIGFGESTEISCNESHEMRDVCAELWDKVEQLTDFCEEKAGYDWQWEFQKPKHPSKGTSSPCVRSKFMRRTNAWREGDDGWFACNDCAGQGLPCFSWTGKEFWLLPLHDQDRRLPVEKDKEIRYWINA